MATPTDLMSLPLRDIHQVSQKLEEEIQFLTTSLKNLKTVQQKFVDSKQCLKMFKEENNEKEILVPLTATLYVPGKLRNPNRVLIDIGTGYYADMESEAAGGYFKRRIEYVTKQMEKIQEALQEKCTTKQVVGEILEVKLKMALQAQQKQQS